MGKLILPLRRARTMSNARKAVPSLSFNQWDYMPAYNNLLPSTITVNFLTEVSNASEVTIEAPNQYFLYDQVTGGKYTLGVENGLLYFEEVEG